MLVIVVSSGVVEASTRGVEEHREPRIPRHISPLSVTRRPQGSPFDDASPSPLPIH
jgi:hypothetical protein